MTGDQRYDRPIQIADGIYWVGFYEENSNFHCNPYLIIDDDKAILIDGGSRPDFDIAQSRRMLIIDNQKMTAQIADFNETTFLSSGDQAVEGFAPSVVINGYGDSSARLFVGVRAEGKELVIYCSRGAYVTDASNALLAAGVPLENQMQADGGASATCARRSARSVNSPPLKNRSRTNLTLFSTCGLSCGWRTRVGSAKKLRC